MNIVPAAGNAPRPHLDSHEEQIFTCLSSVGAFLGRTAEVNTILLGSPPSALTTHASAHAPLKALAAAANCLVSVLYPAVTTAGRLLVGIAPISLAKRSLSPCAAARRSPSESPEPSECSSCSCEPGPASDPPAHSTCAAQPLSICVFADQRRFRVPLASVVVRGNPWVLPSLLPSGARDTRWPCRWRSVGAGGLYCHAPGSARSMARTVCS